MLRSNKTCYWKASRAIRKNNFKVLEKCTKNLTGHSRLVFNNHESNIDCKIVGHFRQ